MEARCALWNRSFSAGAPDPLTALRIDNRPSGMNYNRDNPVQMRSPGKKLQCLLLVRELDGVVLAASAGAEQDAATDFERKACQRGLADRTAIPRYQRDSTKRAQQPSDLSGFNLRSGLIPEAPIDRTKMEDILAPPCYHHEPDRRLSIQANSLIHQRGPATGAIDGQGNHCGPHLQGPKNKRKVTPAIAQ